MKEIRELIHGKSTSYDKGCRCDDCRTAKVAVNRESRLREEKRPQLASAGFLENSSDPRHGTLNGYTNLRCRCMFCTDAKRNYERSRFGGYRNTTSKPIRYGKNEDIGDRIAEASRDKRALRKQRPTIPASWGPSMPFEKRSFDPDLTRLRAASSV